MEVVAKHKPMALMSLLGAVKDLHHKGILDDFEFVERFSDVRCASAAK